MRYVLAGFGVEDKVGSLYACLIDEDGGTYWLYYKELYGTMKNKYNFIVVNVDTDILTNTPYNIDIIKKYVKNGENILTWHLKDIQIIECTSAKRLILLNENNGVYTVIDSMLNVYKLNKQQYNSWKEQYLWYDWGRFYTQDEINSCAVKIQKLLYDYKSRGSIVGVTDKNFYHMLSINKGVALKVESTMLEYKWVFMQSATSLFFNIVSSSDLGCIMTLCDSTSYDVGIFLRPDNKVQVDFGILYNLNMYYNFVRVSETMMLLGGNVISNIICQYSSYLYLGKNIEKFITFSSFDMLKSIDLRNKPVENIATQGLFTHCRYLNEVHLPEGITTLGMSMFEDCISLETIDISNVTSIGTACFKNCYALRTIKFSDKLEKIGNYAFTACKSLQVLKIPDSVSKLGSYAFCMCNYLEEIHLPENIKEIRSYTFEGCSELRKINIPDSVENISSFAFRYCAELKDINIPKGITQKSQLGEKSFLGCNIDILNCEFVSWLDKIFGSNRRESGLLYSSTSDDKKK